MQNMPCSNNSINFNTFGTDLNWKLTTQIKLEIKKISWDFDFLEACLCSSFIK